MMKEQKYIIDDVSHGTKTILIAILIQWLSIFSALVFIAYRLREIIEILRLALNVH